MDARRKREPDMKNRHHRRTEVRSRDRRHAHFRRPGAPRVRGVDPGRALQAVVGAEVDGHDPAVLRAGCPRRWQVPPGLRHDPRGRWRSSARTSRWSPPSRLVWTNEEGGDTGPVTTVTFEERDGKTLPGPERALPSKEALDAAGTGAADAMHETFGQLDELLVTLGAGEPAKAPAR